MKIVGILVIGVICAAVCLMVITQKPEVGESPDIAGEVKTPDAEMEIPVFEEEEALDLGPLIPEAGETPEVAGEMEIPDAEMEIPVFEEEEAVDFGSLI